MVLVLRRQIGGHLQKLLLGFASGVMMAASVWSLLLLAVTLRNIPERMAVGVVFAGNDGISFSSALALSVLPLVSC